MKEKAYRIYQFLAYLYCRFVRVHLRETVIPMASFAACIAACIAAVYAIAFPIIGIPATWAMGATWGTAMTYSYWTLLNVGGGVSVLAFAAICVIIATAVIVVGTVRGLRCAWQKSALYSSMKNGTCTLPLRDRDNASTNM